MEVDAEPEATLEKPKEISGLSADTAHKICSDRVIGSIGVAIKELVENSLDAGATTITVRMKGYGLDLIEVSDNGHGVKESDFETLAKSFHTSKLNEFSDMDSIGTFGFRGEALSSLCRVCDGLEVITRHQSSDSSMKLKFDAAGNLAEKTEAPGQSVGTKVILKKLFSTLPVRRKIFQEKSQIEFSKAVNLLHAYCIILEGVRFQIFHQVTDGKESKKLAYTNGESVKSNMIQILSQKLVQNLLPFKSDGCHNSFDIEGFISSCAHDAGRRVPDKQFFYLNKRPVDMPQVARSINQIYKQFNRHQFPLVVLHVKTKVTESVDVNLAPDKRSVIIKDQTSLQSLVQDVLLKLYEDIPNTISLNDSISTKCKESNNFFEKFSKSNKRPVEESPEVKRPRFTVYESPALKLDNYFVKLPKAPSVREKAGVSTSLQIELVSPKTEKATPQPGTSHSAEVTIEPMQSPLRKASPTPTINKEKSESSSSRSFDLSLTEILKTAGPSLSSFSTQKITKAESVFEEAPKSRPISVIVSPRKAEVEPKKEKPAATQVTEEGALDLTAGASVRSAVITPVKGFTAGLDPLKQDLAEEEFKKIFHKDDFLKMEIIGQFNQGFVIARLNDDVFIIDQHASDEKYNFEKLCKNTKIKCQRLVKPRKLNLSTAQELVFTHHSNIFKQHGYDFQINDDATLGERIELTAVPSLLHATFGLDDVLDVIFQLQDSPFAEVKSKRVRSILASKACRFSVMIGTAMDSFGMRRLVENMATIDQPWNCPHGRPTMRHLFNFTVLQKQYSISKAARPKPNLSKLRSLLQ